MQIEKYLKEYQNTIYQTFVRALSSDHLSHAYLISGNPGTPLLEVAKFLAKSILCDNPSPLACDNCITCTRIDENNYPDFIVIEGNKNTIKKDEIQNIVSQFEKTAFEEKGAMIYILHLVENMTVEAVNSVLKFLEEPGKKIYAFLTTNNENNVLPTIISRCQVLRLKSIDRNIIISQAIEIGIDPTDAAILSYFYNDADLIKETLSNKDENDDYLEAKNAFVQLLESLKDDNPQATIYHTEKNIVPLVKTKSSFRFFLDMIVMALEDILKIRNNEKPYLEIYENTLQSLNNKLSHLDESLIELLKCRNYINLNVNQALLIEHVVNYLVY